MGRYETLVRILDQLIKEAPPENKRYYPAEGDTEKLNQARGRAFIHLFLKVRFGLLDFKERERRVTDGGNDGGVDGYYIDEQVKAIYFIQSKFRTTESNFHEKEIALSELLNMDVERISKGEQTAEGGTEYSGKIKQLQRELTETVDIARYRYEVIILANLSEKNPSKLRKLTGFPTTVFDNERTYKELVFPAIAATFYNPSELRIYLNLSNKTSSSARISYKVMTGYMECDISVLFVPTIEIAKALHTFKNSIMKYNPRSYLELQKNPVNKEIARTIKDLSTNEFAIYNNGITMLSSGTDFNDKIGQKNTAQIIITQPQIINGGQTAFTLSRLYEEGLNANTVDKMFENKEVLLKVVTFPEKEQEENREQLSLIEAISRATNQQTQVDDADRRSNDRVQVEMQKAIFNSFGYFYERKRGEFADGIREGYIQKSQVIDRELFLRLCKSCDMQPSEARRSSSKVLFREPNFANTLKDANRHKEYFFAYCCHEVLSDLERSYSKDRNNLHGVATYGQSLRYGKFAVVTACRLRYVESTSLEDVRKLVDSVLSEWLEFEGHISALPSNAAYFKTRHEGEREILEANFDGYYKGRTVNADLVKYFKASLTPRLF